MNSYEEARQSGGRSSSSSSSRSGGGGGGGSTTSSRRSGGRSAASNLLSTTAILDIVERLGLVDMLVDRLKGRLEEVDIDELIDEVGDYLKRNPEVMVVSLGAVTIAAGALVYLNRRNEGGSRKQSGPGSGGSEGGSRSRRS